MRLRALLAFGLASLITLALASLEPSLGRWQASYAPTDPAIQRWFQTQHNQKGEWCCNEADGHPYFGGYDFNADGSVNVELNGQKHVLPNYMVLNGHNPTGNAVWWYLDVGSTHRDYCFAPGSLT